MCRFVANNPGRFCLILKKEKHISPASALQQPQRNLFFSSHSCFSLSIHCQWPPPPPNLQKPGPLHPAINIIRLVSLIVNLIGHVLTYQKTLVLHIQGGTTDLLSKYFSKTCKVFTFIYSHCHQLCLWINHFYKIVQPANLGAQCINTANVEGSHRD